MFKRLRGGVVSLMILGMAASSAVQAADVAKPAKSSCRPIAVDKTGSDIATLMANAQGVTPVSSVEVSYASGSAPVRSASQEFEITNPDGTKSTVTVVCKSSICGAGCQTVGCDPGSNATQTWCTACGCVPQPPALLCTPNSCTCEKTTTSSGTTGTGL